MTEYVTGQIYGWNGGECPVHPETKIKVWSRGGILSSDKADYFVWGHGGFSGDIIAFQVITPYAEPKTIWVNEYADGDFHAYSSEDMARTYSHTNHTRVAVKYVEVKE